MGRVYICFGMSHYVNTIHRYVVFVAEPAHEIGRTAILRLAWHESWISWSSNMLYTDAIVVRVVSMPGKIVIFHHLHNLTILSYYIMGARLD